MSESSRSPRAELPKLPFDPGSVEKMATWDAVLARLRDARIYWMATNRPGAAPHVMPVWGIWADGALYFSTSESSVKGRNLRRDPHCTVTLGDDAAQFIVEGRAKRVTGEGALKRFISVYTPKYSLPMEVRDGEVHFEGGHGPVFAVKPETVFAFSDDGAFTMTRFRFD